MLENLKESAKLQASDEILKGIEANTEALDNENEKLQYQEALRQRRLQEMQKERKMLKESLVDIGNTLGIQESTVSDLFDSFKDGFTDAGEAAQQFGALFNDVIAGMAAAENERINQRLDDLAREKEIALAFAGESAEGREAVEERFRKRERELQKQKLENDRRAAIFQAIINTISAVVEALPNIPLSVAVGLLGAANTAIIASKKVPAFKDGVTDFEGGLAYVGDGGKEEPITDRSGRLIGVSPRTSTLVDLPKGANVYKDWDTFKKQLNKTLGNNDINPLGGSVYGQRPNVNVSTNGGFDEGAMERVMRRTLAQQPKYEITMDKSGIRTFINSQMGRTERLDNRVTMKGTDV